MPSSINPYNVDGTFPVAGQDNSSQGFRDNFTSTQNNFIFAKSEIDDLQSKVIVASPLNGQVLNNDMAGTQLIRPQLKAWTQAVYDLGVASSSATLNFNVANFQKVTTGGSISLYLTNWPAALGYGNATGYGSLRVWIVVSDIGHTVTLPPEVSIGVNDITGYNTTTRAISFDRLGNYIFDFSSIDGGLSYFIADPMRNRSTIRDNTLVTGALNISGNVFMSSNLTITNSVVSPTSSMVITGDLAGYALAQNYGVMLHVTGQSGYPGRVYIDGQGTGNYAAVVGRHYNGNVTVPTGLNAGDIISRFGATPYHSTGWPSITTTRIDMVADETQTSTTLGSRLDFYITANTTATATKQMVINTAGVSSVGNLTAGGNLITTSITTPAGTSANLLIDPDGNADVIINAANVWLNAGHLRSSASTFTIANVYPTTGYILGNASAIYIGATVSTVTTGGNLSVSGNVTHTAGFVDQGYQYSAPSANFATQISNGKSRMIFDPTTTITTGNVIMPNVAVDGTIISIHSTATITTFGANSLQTGTVVKPSNTFTLSAGTGIEYFYHAVENTWYKIR